MPEEFSSSMSAPSPVSASEALRREGWVWGRFGLRAGWGMAIFVVVWLLASFIASIFAIGASGQMGNMLQAHNAGAHKFQLLFTATFVCVNDGITFLAMLGAAFFFSRAERRPFGAYGIGRARINDFLPGAFWGLALMTGLVALLWAEHLLIFDSRALTLGPAIRSGCKWFIAFLLVGFAEEYFFRGYLQFTLMRGMWGLGERVSPENPRRAAFWLAALLLSGGFALMHLGNSGETHFGLAAVFLAGITFACALWRTGSLWWAIGFHATWDWAQSFLYGVADSGNISVGRLFVTHPAGNPLLSGGPDGPEGSVLVVLPLLLTLVILRFTKRGPQPTVEQMAMPFREVPESHIPVS